jgi:hypothetical protein
MKVTFNIELTEGEVEAILSRRGIEEVEKGLMSEIHNTLLLKFKTSQDKEEYESEAHKLLRGDKRTSTREKSLI